MALTLAEHRTSSVPCEEGDLAGRGMTFCAQEETSIISVAMRERNILLSSRLSSQRSLKCFLDYFHSAEEGMSKRFCTKRPSVPGEQHLTAAAAALGAGALQMHPLLLASKATARRHFRSLEEELPRIVLSILVIVLREGGLKERK